MCLGIPFKIIKIDENVAVGEMSGIKKKIRIDLIPQLKTGDFVLVHAGFAIETIDKEEAEETLEIFKESFNVLNDNFI